MVLLLRALTLFLSLQVTWAQTNPATIPHTISGAPKNSDIVFEIKRICVSNPFSANKMAIPVPPILEIGGFKAEYNVQSRDFAYNSKAIERLRAVKYEAEAKNVEKKALGTKEYTFENYKIRVPVEDLEAVMGTIEPPQSSNLLKDYVDVAVTKELKRGIKMAGMYVKVENVTSFVAFDGANSNVVPNLQEVDDVGNRPYEQIWPKVATLIGSSRPIRSQAAGHISHLDESPGCSVSTNFDYTMSVERRPTRSETNRSNRLKGVR